MRVDMMLRHLVVVILIAPGAVQAGPARLQDATTSDVSAAEPPEATTAIAAAAASEPAPEPDPPAPALIRFNFKDAPFDQVLDFFSRTTGLPVVLAADVPTGPLTYLSPEAYEFDEALRVLNIILQSRGVMLRVSDDMLHLVKLSDVQRSDVPTFVGQLPAEVTDDQVVTVVRPLGIAVAKPLAEQLAGLVAEYGAVAALDQQNSLVITETAAQVRRLLTIVEELDREDPEGLIEIFKIRNTRAEDIIKPLQSLLAQKVQKFVIDSKGKKTLIEEDQLPGLNITPDVRTNSLVAKGVQSRIDKLREVIALLDVPATETGRRIRTLSLALLSPKEAQARLNEIYAKLPEADRPVVVALPEQGRVSIVGSEAAITEGAALIREIDGGGADAEPRMRRVDVIQLDHADPEGLITALRSLLDGRQADAVRLVAGPDGASIIVNGADADVASVRRVAESLDRPATLDRAVRVLRLTVGDPAGVLARAEELFALQRDDADPADNVMAELDADGRTLTLVGSDAALDRFTATLRMAESSVVVERETRQLPLTHALPTDVAPAAIALARPLLAPRDGRPYVAPEIEPIDALDLVLVTAPVGSARCHRLARGHARSPPIRRTTSSVSWSWAASATRWPSCSGPRWPSTCDFAAAMRRRSADPK